MFIYHPVFTGESPSFVFYVNTSQAEFTLGAVGTENWHLLSRREGIPAPLNKFRYESG